MKIKLREYNFIAATCDCWSKSNKSFIAVTVHCINDNSLEPATYYLACEPFPGSHNTEATARKLHNIFTKYEILHKVFFITTDGAKENEAALEYYGNNYRELHQSIRANFFADFCENHELLVSNLQLGAAEQSDGSEQNEPDVTETSNTEYNDDYSENSDYETNGIELIDPFVEFNNVANEYNLQQMNRVS